MPRALTLPAIRDSLREQGTDVFLILLIIDTLVAGPDRYIFIVNNTENIVSQGTTYIACPFSLSLPDTQDNLADAAQVSIDNVDPRIWQGLRAMTGEAAWVALRIILASDPDTIVLESGNLRLREADTSSAEIRGKLIVDSIWQSGFPAHDFDPPQNPGMFTS